ncbi:MAG: N-ethylammeline chlorohydrolase [Rhodospirillaceae bacterium]|nr:N-ethylammeline chlorohydrolase [Rhodospirillaceae bacterium]
MTTTVVRRADWVVAWDEGSQSHTYLRDADVAFDEQGILSVGDRYEGEASTEIDGRHLMVMPGLVNIHTHPTSEPLRKGLTDETRSPGFWHSSLYEFLTVFVNDRDGNMAAMRVAMAELLMSGVTTVADLSIPFDGWLDTLAESGIRTVAAPMFRDARWFTRDGHSLEYDWDEGAGQEAFAEARRQIDLANQHPSGRLSGMVCPAQVDTCSAELIEQAYDHAKGRNLPFQIHAAQSVTEFHEMIRRHGKTPIRWLHEIGALGDHSIIGHGIFLDHHPWLHWTTREDLGLLADVGATVAHCPTVFLRRGITLRTFGDYVRAGVNMGIGTDTYPHNYLEEMRSAANHARTIAGTVDDLETADIFNAATIGGAKALRRDDIGRVSKGAKADLVLVDLRHPSMMPVREPLRSLIYVAADRAIRDVYVGGELVVENGTPLNIDLDAASLALEEAQHRSLEQVPDRDWAGRNADELAPMVFSTLPTSD